MLFRHEKNAMTKVSSNVWFMVGRKRPWWLLFQLIMVSRSAGSMSVVLRQKNSMEEEWMYNGRSAMESIGFPCGYGDEGNIFVCWNGGICRPGNATFVPQANKADGLPVSLQGSNKNQGGYYCECPSPANETAQTYYTGLTCEIPYVECPYPNRTSLCYHGGSCWENPPDKWDADTAVCNCSAAHYNNRRWSGRNCEKMIAPSNNTNRPNLTTTRPQPDTDVGKQVCDLRCSHGGSCQMAGPDNPPRFGSLRNMFCLCPNGFAGVQCEHIAQSCGTKDNLFYCLHGSTCRQGSDQSFDCVCPDKSYYIGGNCIPNNKDQIDHSTVVHCNPTKDFEFAYGMAVPAFCVNGGTCREDFKDGLLFSGCDCPKAFTGPHCEFVHSASDGTGIDFTPGVKPWSQQPINIFLLVVLCLGIAFGVGVRWYRRYKIHKHQQSAVILNLQSFRDENQGAVSANGSLLYPSITQQQQQHQKKGNNRFSMGELMYDVEIS